MTTFESIFVAGFVLAIVQFLAALPWIWAIDKRGFVRWVKDPIMLAGAAGVVLIMSFLIASSISKRRVAEVLNEQGLYYGVVLHIQLAIDFLIIMPQLVLLVWPKGGAIAISTFRECWRQPMFWLIAVLAVILIIGSMVVPYFTFGEDYKMMKQLGFDIIMLSGALFGLLAASISINEEIEGRTAITVMSKPVNRRQFIIGKYIGTLMGCAALMLLLGWFLTGALKIKPYFDRLDDVDDTMPNEMVKFLTPGLEKIIPTPEGAQFAKGIGSWIGEASAHHVGILLTFGQVMVLLSICVALATRLQFVINLVICLFVFLLGHLAPVLVQVTSQLAQESAALKLVAFIAQLLNALFPALEYFDMGPAIIRDSVVPMWDFSSYVASVFGYAVLYSIIGLILGLILFEDRDLA